MQKGHVAVRWQAAAASHRAQWWTMSCSRHKHVPINQLLGGAAWAGGALSPPPAGFSQAVSTAPRALTPRAVTYTPQQVTLMPLLLPAALFIQCTIQGRQSNPPSWNHGWSVLLVPLGTGGKSSFVLHLAQETEGPWLDLSCNASPF